MKTKDLYKSIDKIKIDSDTKEGVLELIYLKIENDMKEVLNEIKRLEDKQETKFSMLIWAIGIGATIVSVLLTIIALKG